jgi:signal transduction histidine kinase
MPAPIRLDELEDQTRLSLKIRQLERQVMVQANGLTKVSRRLDRFQREQGRMAQFFEGGLKSQVANLVTFLRLVNAGLFVQEDPICLNLSQSAEQSAREMLAVLEDLIDIQLIDAGQRVWKVAALDVHSLVTKLKLEFQPLAAEREVNLVIEPGLRVMVEADPALLERVLRHLIDNALKLAWPGGRVFVSMAVEQAEEMVIIAVADDGPALGQAERQNIFELFAGDPRRPRSGQLESGLGLAFSYRALQLMQGVLWVESSQSLGCTYKLSLRRARL